VPFGARTTTGRTIAYVYRRGQSHPSRRSPSGRLQTDGHSATGLIFALLLLEVRDARPLDGPDLLELHFCVPEVVEEASTVAEQRRDDVELKYVEQTRC